MRKPKQQTIRLLGIKDRIKKVINSRNQIELYWVRVDSKGKDVSTFLGRVGETQTKKDHAWTSSVLREVMG